MNPTELTLIVITHNRAELLNETLESISTQRWDGAWDVLVVDNGSTDTTSEILARWVDSMPVPMRVIRAVDGQGAAYARNTGADHAEAPHLAFLDDDDLLAPGWVAAIGDALRDHALVGCRHEFHRLNPAEFADADDIVGHEGFSSVGGVPITTSAGMGCHAELWHALGGMDELHYGEDTDFSLRASARGVDPHFVAEAVLHFRLRGDVRSAFRRGRHLGRSSVRTYVRRGRDLGQRHDATGVLIRSWLGYIIRLPTLVNRGRRLVYAQQLGRRVGRLQGSFAARVWYP